MKITATSKKLSSIKADVSVVFVLANNPKHKWVKNAKEMKKAGFTCSEETTYFNEQSNTLHVGLASLNNDDIRLASSTALKALKNKKISSIKIGSYAKKGKTNLVAMVEGFILGSYVFDKYKKAKSKKNIKNIIISTENYKGKDVKEKTLKRAVKVGRIISNSTNWAKDMINTTPMDLTPLDLASEAKKLMKLKNVTCEVMGKDYLEEQNMGSFLAVNQASHIPPRLIHLTYKPKKAKKTIAYVGKGLTYDTGGLSLKPGSFMTTMKGDMGGAAAVMGILRAAAKLDLPYEIHAVIGATENAIGPKAIRPDDVVKASNGKTIEIKNTDAEGRLVLADCLVYAQRKIKCDKIIDIATLTGACVVALGEYSTGVMGHNDKLKANLMKHANTSGEYVGTLPFNKYLKGQLKSSVADISNVGADRYGGAITAALFLDNFIEKKNKKKWLHLDIAATFSSKEWGYTQYGGMGAGIRMNLYWLMNSKGV